jgi:DNA-binding IclR family transcriptional regulator
LTVLREESDQSLQAGGWIGRRSPLHCTASGRALMFDADDEQVEALTARDLVAPAAGPGAPKDLAALLQRLGDERRRGYSTASEEVEVGLTSMSAPVRDGLGHIAGVINVSGPTSRLGDRIDAVGALLLRAAQTASRTLRITAVG